MHKEALEWGQSVLRQESKAVAAAAERLDESFVKALELIFLCTGKVVITGLGKSGHIGAKIASTLSSTGTPSFFLHPTEALHGDFGMISDKDVLIAIAYGGETREVLETCRYAHSLGIQVIGLTGSASSSLAQSCHVVLSTYVSEEADPMGLAPTASSTVTLALGDALSIALMRKRDFGREHFAKLHPGGKLGRSLAFVSELMKTKKDLSYVTKEDDFHNILESVTSPNFGIVAVVEEGTLVGSVTDGDLRRALLKHSGEALNMKACQLMNQSPKTITPNVRALDAVSLMEEYKITSLFVCERNNRLVGLVRLHDLLSASPF